MVMYISKCVHISIENLADKSWWTMNFYCFTLIWQLHKACKSNKSKDQLILNFYFNDVYSSLDKFLFVWIKTQMG